MMEPHRIEIDHTVGAGYIKYTDSAIARTVDVWEDGQVAADYDSSNRVVGIEVLGFDEETLEHAKHFAKEHDLAFPSDLRGNLILTG